MDISTRYMGLSLKNPVVPSASPLSQSVSSIRRLEDAGAGAVTIYSLFEEQIDMEALSLHHFLERGADSYAEALTYFPQQEDFRATPDSYLNLISKAKESVDIPVIASLNGVTAGGWTSWARNMQEAGADALELNIYYIPVDAQVRAGDVEQTYVDILTEVKRNVTIPVAMKLSPFFTAFPGFAQRLDQAGADSLVLFNRFYQPDLDLDELAVVPNLILSTPAELRLPLRWIAILYGHLGCSLALTSGIHSSADALKAVAAGADVANVCSVLLKEGVGKLTEIVSGMEQWLEEHEYESLTQMKGSLSQRNCPEPQAFERANYMKILNTYRWPGFGI